MNKELINLVCEDANKNIIKEIENLAAQYKKEKEKFEKASKIIFYFNKDCQPICTTTENETIIKILKDNCDILLAKIEGLGNRLSNLDYNFRDYR